MYLYILSIFNWKLDETFWSKTPDRTRNPIDDLPFMEYHIGNDEYLRETLEFTIIFDSSPCINHSISGKARS